jgi:hypothetical protein
MRFVITQKVWKFLLNRRAKKINNKNNEFINWNKFLATFYYYLYAYYWIYKSGNYGPNVIFEIEEYKMKVISICNELQF